MFIVFVLGLATFIDTPVFLNCRFRSFSLLAGTSTKWSRRREYIFEVKSSGVMGRHAATSRTIWANVWSVISEPM